MEGAETQITVCKAIMGSVWPFISRSQLGARFLGFLQPTKVKCVNLTPLQGLLTKNRKELAFAPFYRQGN